MYFDFQRLFLGRYSTQSEVFGLNNLLCALLLPVVTMNALIAPRLIRSGATRYLWPTSAALVAGCCAIVTPLAAALVPPAVALPPGRTLEADVEARRPRDPSTGEPATLYSSRPLY